MFDALLAIYNWRVADLLRIYTGGTGVLPSGAIHPDLVGRLAGEAAKSARHVLTMAIRALDYLPAVDVTFFDYLRALITADFEMVSHDRHNYRVAFVEAFSRHGIFPGPHDEQARDGARALSADTLRWPAFNRFDIRPRMRAKVVPCYRDIINLLKSYADECLYLSDREALFRKTREYRTRLHALIGKAFEAAPEFAATLQLDAARKFEVHTLRRAMRVRLDGRVQPQVFVSLTQSELVPRDDAAGVPEHKFRGGATLVVDLAESAGGGGLPLPKYQIVKSIASRQRREAAAAIVRAIDADPLLRLYFAVDHDEPFAALHELAEEGT